jgi:hypothetical protein
VSLPNVGRESHSYLTHIIRNWDDLAEWTVFTQGSLDRHCDADTFLNSIAIPKADGWTPTVHNVWRMSRDQRVLDYCGEAQVPWEGNMVAFWDRYVRRPWPTSNDFQCGAIFGVSRRRILARSLEEYVDMRRPLTVGNAVEAGHFCERSWQGVFGGSCM